MQLLHALWFRVRELLFRDAVNAEVDEELAYHIARETEANRQRGMNDGDARRLALARFGGVQRFREACRDERDVHLVDDAMADLRHAIRLLRKNALFSAAVIATLALGIGGTSTMFTIVHAVLLRPLPFPEPDRIVSLSESVHGVDREVVGTKSFEVWHRASRSLASMALHSFSSAVFTGTGEPREYSGARATASLFRTLGVHALLGRALLDDEELTGAPRVVVLSHSLWRSRFGGDSSIVGRAIVMNGVTRTVVGVMPSSMTFPDQAMYWTPLQLPASAPGDQTEYYFSAVGRMRAGTTLANVRREMERLEKQADAARSAANRGGTAVVVSLHDRLFGSVAEPLSLLFGAVVLLLLVACANVANLTLARSSARSREFAVRLALGAGRWRLARQLFIESALLAMIGGALGALLPTILVGAFVKMSQNSVAGVSDIHVNGTVVAFTVGVTVIAALLFGLAPALMSYRAGTHTTLTNGSARMTSGKQHHVLRSSLVVVELAAALTLLTGAGLITRSFARAQAVDPGFNAQQVMAASTSLPSSRYPTLHSKIAYYQRIEEQLRALPTVDAVGVGDVLPLRGYAMQFPYKRTDNDQSPVTLVVSRVTSEYPRAIGMHLREGRLFNANDREGALPVAVLTASAARQLFADGHALGKTLRRTTEDTASARIVVGIVDDVVQLNVESKPTAHVFIPAEQDGGYPGWLVVRGRMDPVTFERTLRRIALDIDPLQPMTTILSMPDVLSSALAPRRLNTVVINAFAWVALVLAMIGLYGLLAQAVAARTPELGIRMALGAGHAAVIRLILRQAGMLAALGIAIGVALSFALARTTQSMLYDTGAHDPVIFLLAPTVLTLVAAVACYIPARRATRVDPLIALRAE